MATSVTDLKNRLRSFLADPSSEAEFRAWFAFTLRDASSGSNPDLESLAHTIQKAFSDAASGYYDSEELKAVLSFLAKPTQCSPEYIIVFPWPPVLNQQTSSARGYTLNEVRSPETVERR